MLTKKLQITCYNAKGKIEEQVEWDGIAFNKEGNMSIFPSRTFEKMLRVVDKGGAIFIERAWKVTS